MSCEKCNKSHEESAIAYYRWDIANIALKGCAKHLREIFNVLSFWQDAGRRDKQPLLLHPESWQNIFDCIRDSKINSQGNFWAAIQELERQTEEIKAQAKTE